MASSSDPVVLRRNNARGETAYANRDFAAGDVVVKESPWLVIRDDSLCDRFASCSGVPPDTWCPLVACRSLSPENIVRLRRWLYSPVSTGDAPADALHCDVTRSEMEGLKAIFSDPRWFGEFFPASCPSFDYWRVIRLSVERGETSELSALASFLHACRINTHGSAALGQRAIFPTCCKLSHSCNPNTMWYLSDGDAVHVALRPIAQGDELSFSYIGNGMNVLVDTPRRRDELVPLHFVCRCSRCSRHDEGADTSRLLRCPTCRAVSMASGRAGVWQCRQCSFAVPPSEVQAIGALLANEAFVFTWVMKAHFAIVSGPPQRFLKSCAPPDILKHFSGAFDGDDEITSRLSLTTGVLDVLGPEHYLFALSALCCIRLLLAVDASEPFFSSSASCGWMETISRQWIPRLEGWFRANAPLSYHHIALYKSADTLRQKVKSLSHFIIPTDVSNCIKGLADVNIRL